MTNEDKAKILAHEFFETNVWCNDVKAALMEMAKWKEEQLISLIVSIHNKKLDICYKMSSEHSEWCGDNCNGEFCEECVEKWIEISKGGKE